MTATASLPAETTLGPAHLVVADLDRSLAFYAGILGFTVASHTDSEATLTAGDSPTPLLRLTALPDARPKPARSTGLYHVAILMPSRHELARVLRRLVEHDYPLQGAADHLVSEALYLADPDGNGLELYRDRPRSDWSYTPGGQIQMDSLPVNLRALLAEGDTAANLDPGTIVGHVHLHVAHLDEAVAFYRDVLGFDLMAQLGGQAAFLSAGGYHHHIGLNTWAGVGAPPPPADAAGLRVWDVVLPSADALAAVASRLRSAGAAIELGDGEVLTRDPSGNAVRLVVATK